MSPQNFFYFLKNKWILRSSGKRKINKNKMRKKSYCNTIIMMPIGVNK